MEKSFITTDAGRVAYIDRGAGPAVLFIHGFPTSSRLWDEVISRLDGSYRCVAPDLMGLGDAEVGSDADLSMPAQADMLVSLMDALGVERAAIVAHDQGGAAAQLLAVKRPERASKLLLIDSVCHDNWPVSGVKFLQKLARLPGSSHLFASSVVRSFADILGMGLRAGFYDKSRLTPEIRAEFTRTVMSSPERVERYKRFLLAGDSRHTMEISEKLGEIEAPTLVIWGEKDPFLELKWGEKLASAIPNAKGLIVIRECGHFPQWEKPEELAAHLLGFLARGDAPNG